MKGSLTQLAVAAFLMGSIDAATIVNTGQTVGGTTFSVNPSTGNVGGQASKSTSGTDLIVTVANPADPNDWYITWGVNQPAANIPYVQIDFAAAPGSGTGNFSIFWSDSDSGIGGANNSFTGLGSVTPSTTSAFSVVIDLTDGGTNTSGAKGWGGGNIGNFRIDPFEAELTNDGVAFTITGVTFGNTLVPEPSTAALLGLGGLALILRRRK